MPPAVCQPLLSHPPHRRCSKLCLSPPHLSDPAGAGSSLSLTPRDSLPTNWAPYPTEKGGGIPSPCFNFSSDPIPNVLTSPSATWQIYNCPPNYDEWDSYLW
ncbi:hypothetical protein KIL84_020390 [Mauremys mutica]|uniref:Uncharacterized protein n=1 Tax=Mauremys mutica TaxID=74926 RepID=A0A9D3XYA3_9SAUR|nr:hypothetical protein KIL84_020390 [Mauremys mutica]